MKYMKKIQLLILTLFIGFSALGQQTYFTTAPTGSTSLTGLQYRYKAITPDSLNQLFMYWNGKYNQVYTATEANLRFAPISSGGYVPNSRLVSTNSGTFLFGGGNLGSNLLLYIDTAGVTTKTFFNTHIGTATQNALDGKAPITGGSGYIKVSGQSDITGDATIEAGNYTLALGDHVNNHAVLDVVPAAQTVFIAASDNSTKRAVATLNPNAFNLGLENINSPYEIMQLQFNPYGGAVFIDQFFNKGLEYADDYESNFTNRSLVTKQYVDGLGNGYIQNQNTSAQASSNFWIDGTGTLGLAIIGDPSGTNTTINPYNLTSNNGVYQGYLTYDGLGLSNATESWSGYLNDATHQMQFSGTSGLPTIFLQPLRADLAPSNAKDVVRLTDLSAYAQLAGSYANPAWVASLAATKINGLTTGSVVFADGSGNLTQDNSNLFWDNTNKVLITKKVTGATTSAGTLTLSSTSHATKGKILFGTSAYDEVNNRLGLNVTSPTATLDVNGDTFIRGLLTANLNNINLGNIFVFGGGLVGVTSTSILQFFGSTGVSFRNTIGSSTNGTLSTGVNYGNTIISSAPITTAASGTHSMVASLVVNPVGTITPGGAAVTNTASLYVEAAGSGGTNNYALYVNSGASFFGGSVTSTSTIKTGGYTVATLPTGVLGQFAYVTDALAPTFLTTVVGGGAIKCPVFYNGTNWVAH